jgi:hypothetical protein
MSQLQTTILQKLVNDEAYCRKVLPFVKPEYFEGAHKSVYRIVLDFIGKYNKLPTSEALLIDLEASASAMDEHNYPAAVKIVEDLKLHPTVEEKWLLENTEKWCKDRAVFLAIVESFQIIDGKKKDKSRDGIPDILQKALAINFDNSVGHDYINDFSRRFDFYHTVEERIPFDLDMLNSITKGGVPRKTLNIILAGCVHPETRVHIRLRKRIS